MYSLKSKIEKLEQKKGMKDEINIILRSRESSNPWGFQLSTAKTCRDLTIPESLELLHRQFTGEAPIGYPFKPKGDTFHDFVVAFDEYGGFKHPELRKETINKIREHGYTPPKPSLLPKSFVELTITNNKDPTDYLRG